MVAKRGKRKLWQMKSQVGTKFSYVMWSCQFVRFVKPLGSKSKGLWRTVYLASPSRQVCFSLFIGQFICSFLFDFHFVRLFSFFFTCILVGRTATNFASFFFGFFFSHYSRFGVLIIISNRFITLSFTCTSDEEREAKPKKRRKRTKELPKEDSSDDGNNDVNTFNMEHRLFLVMCLSSSCEVAVIQKKFKKTARRVCSDDKRTT